MNWADKNRHGYVEPWGIFMSSGFIAANPSVVERTWQKTLHESLHKLQPEKFTRVIKRQNLHCSARDWERSGLLEENPQSGCTEICASLKGPL